MNRLKEAYISWIEKIGCHHDWHLISKVNVHNEFGGSFIEYQWVCKKCGKIKNTKSNHG